MVSPHESDPFLLLCALMVELAADAERPGEPAVVQARIDVYRHLVDEGWQPPERVRSLLHLNDLVLALDVEQWLASAAEQAPETGGEPGPESGLVLGLPSPPAPGRVAPPDRAQPPRADTGLEAALIEAYSGGLQVDVREVDPVATRLVAEAEDDLRAVVRPLDATRRLVALVQELGGDLAAADEQRGATQDADVLPLDLSFAAGPPLLVRAEALSLARLRLERHLPGLVEVARRALAEAAR